MKTETIDDKQIYKKKVIARGIAILTALASFAWTSRT